MSNQANSIPESPEDVYSLPRLSISIQISTWLCLLFFTQKVCQNNLKIVDFNIARVSYAWLMLFLLSLDIYTRYENRRSKESRISVFRYIFWRIVSCSTEQSKHPRLDFDHSTRTCSVIFLYVSFHAFGVKTV